jgi:membrane protein required for colicin V production
MERALISRKFLPDNRQLLKNIHKGKGIMNALDWVLIFVGAFWVLRGLMRGAVSQIFGIAGILAGFYMASHQYQFVGAMINKQFPSLPGNAVLPVSFILMFLLTWFIIAVIGHWIVRMMRMAGMGFLDRLWGGMIGFGKALLFSVIVISLLILFSPGENPALVTQSQLAPMVMQASQYIFKLAPAQVQNELVHKQEEFKKLLDNFLPTKDSKGNGGNKN